jgi:glycosyltransferase involved in cell wall biosynthesis
LVHTHFVFPICTNFTFPVCEKLKIPFTVFAHAFDIFRRDNAEANRINEISRSRYCKAIFTLSEFHKNYLIERNALPDKIVITKQASSYEIADLAKREGRIKSIVSISRFVEKKGLDVLIDAAKLLEDEDFVFEIYGFGELQDELQGQIDDLKCKNISIKGELKPDEVSSKLKQSDLMAAPCKVARNGDMDGFPTSIFEAMGCGVPFVTTSVSAIPEIVKDGVNGFITEPENPEKFAAKILEVSKLSADELFEIRKRAQKDVKSISSVDNTMNRFIDTIKS